MRETAIKLALAVVLGAVLTAGAYAAVEKVTAAGDFVYGGSADPTYLDPALVSDGESFRVTEQIFDGLVDLKPGTLKVEPSLATKYSVNKSGKIWTFTLRRNVKFHDGTRFNAAAVCANFNRWYNFTGPFQDATATYYYQAIFGGFRRNGNSDLSTPLYSGCRTKGAYTAVVSLRKRNGPFLPSLVLSAFSMQSPTAMSKWGANRGELRSGTFYPTGSYAFSHPTGTGPFRFGSWRVGERVILNRNNTYWGKKAKIKRLIIRPISNNTSRLQALQSREINGYDNVAPQDISIVKRNTRLKVLNRPSFNVAYVTINQAKPPMNRLAVRQAVAHGLNRAAVVKAFYAGRAQVAHEFMPPSLPGYDKNVKKYAYNPERAKTLLRGAGFTLPVSIEFWYPTDVTRPYMPNPGLNFQAFKASLELSGFRVTARSAPWRPDYVKNVNDGTAGHLNLIGWTGDYGDADNFLGTFFQSFSPQFGFRNNTIHRLLDRAEAEVNAAKRVTMYKQANRLIMNFLPGVPYAHSRPAIGLEKRVQGYTPNPQGTDDFDLVSFGGQ